MAYFDKYGVEFSDDRKTLVKCPQDFQGNYVIPDGVVDIDTEAFKDCAGLASVTIPDSVVTISCSVFEGCLSLTSVKIPQNVRSVGIGAFSGCRSLSSIVVDYNNRFLDSRDNCNAIILTCAHSLIAGCKNTLIHHSIKNICEYAFANMTALHSIVIPNSVTNIWNNAFCGCTGLESIKMGNNVEFIGDCAFYGCTSLTSISIPNSVTYIGIHAFSMCSALTSLVIPSSVNCINNPAFVGCDSLTAICVVPDNPHYISKDGVLFDKDKTTLIQYPGGLQGSYIIPHGIKYIEDGAFLKCRKLSSISIPDGVVGIGKNTFQECSLLHSIEIPDSVTNIGSYAFACCDSLESVSLGKNITSIGVYVFYNLFSLRKIYVDKGEKSHFLQLGLEKYTDIIAEQGEMDDNEKEIKSDIEELEQQRLLEQQMHEMMQGSILFFDTETTGTPRNYKAPISDSSNWPRLVQLAWIMADKSGNILKKKSLIIRPSGFTIPADAAAVHGITTEKAEREGVLLCDVLDEFETDLSFAGQIVGHNIDFDQHIVGAELYRLGMKSDTLMDKPCICTMKSSTDFCAIPNPNPYFGGYKWPSLQELYCKLFGHEFSGAHDAFADASATKECFFELKRRGIIP